MRDAGRSKEKTKSMQAGSMQGKQYLMLLSLPRLGKEFFFKLQRLGYYGNSGDRILDETSPPGDDFLSKLCVAWEASTANTDQFAVRRIILRTGLVLTPKAGVLKKLLLPFRLFAGGKYGSGEQWWPWIHIVDQIDAMIYLIENEKASGVFNLTSPQPLKMKDFGKALARALNRPYWGASPRCFAANGPGGNE